MMLTLPQQTGRLALLLAAWSTIAKSLPQVLPGQSSGGAAIYRVTAAEWKALNTSVHGRLAAGRPINLPCYSSYNGTLANNDPDLAMCGAAEQNKANSTFIVDHFGGYEYQNWEQCAATTQGCLLSSNLPADPASPIAGTCYQGSVPNYYINVQQVSDVQAGLAFAHAHSIPLVVKNTGHDYKGRSSAPNSLALWMHNVQPPLKLTKAFTPDGCSAPVGNVVTMGAGQGFGPLYDFANANNVTVVGGTSETVGAAGGWITGGGHSALSNTLGLGVDNVQQIKAVLPNGTYITANRCQNTDMFFALRGGGGGTFAVNMEMTTLAHPVQPLQYAEFLFGSLNPTDTYKLISIMTANANKWASEGWGGYAFPGAVTNSVSIIVLMTPSLTLAEAEASMEPITSFLSNITYLNGALENSVTTIPSFYTFFTGSGSALQNANGNSVALSSRIIPSTNFEPASQNATTDAIYNIFAADQSNNTSPIIPLFICITAPSSYKVPESDQPGGPGASAVTPAWRTGPWHLIHYRGWDPIDPTAGGTGSIAASFQAVHNEMNPLRKLTPTGGAYQNEADPFEPNPAATFWGQANYDRLLKIKHEVDPNNILTCHQCIGWDSTDARYSCYPSVSSSS